MSETTQNIANKRNNTKMAINRNETKTIQKNANDRNNTISRQ